MSLVLTGSIRDDGPLPEVIGNAYEGQTKCDEMVKKSTTVICLATMLHTIATGNMTSLLPCAGGRNSSSGIPLYSGRG